MPMLEVDRGVHSYDGDARALDEVSLTVEPGTTGVATAGSILALIGALGASPGLVLSIIGASSPMLGLLGTVSGMIKAFSAMGREGMGDPTLLAGHISEALVSTATGLIIAIPALFAHSFLEARAGGIITDMETELIDLLHFVRRAEERNGDDEGAA